MLWLSSVETPRPKTEERLERLLLLHCLLCATSNIEQFVAILRLLLFASFHFILVIFHCGFAFLQSTALRKSRRGQEKEESSRVLNLIYNQLAVGELNFNLIKLVQGCF